MTTVRSTDPVEYRVGDVLKLRKQHPCGGFEWTVYRIGADIGIQCKTCTRRLMLPRRDLERKTRNLVFRGPEPTLQMQHHIARLGPALDPVADQTDPAEVQTADSATEPH